MADNGKQTLRDSLVVSVAAAIAQGLATRNGIAERNGMAPFAIDHVGVGKVTNAVVNSVIAHDEHDEERTMLFQIKNMLEVLTDMREQGKKRELVGLGMMKLRDLATMRSMAITHEVLAMSLTMANVSPASVN